MADNGFEMAAALWSGSTLGIEAGRCVNIRGRSEICARCEKACPKAAITLTLDAVIVTDDCSDCGACLPACPTGALQLTGFSPRALLHAVEGRTSVHLHCRESAGEEAEGRGGVVIPCHQVLDARLIAAIAGCGCGEVAIHGLKYCESCRHGGARKGVEKIARTLKRWLGEDAPRLVLDPQAQTARQRRKPARHDQIRLARRGFFRLAGAQVASAATGWVAPLAPQAPEADFPCSGALVPAAPEPYQACLAAKAGDIAWKEASLPIYQRTFSDACTLCMACAERCPTGALQKLASPQARAITFTSLQCTNCGLCTRICPFDAITSQAVRTPAHISAISTGAAIVLAEMAQRSCRQCASTFSDAAPEGGEDDDEDTQAGLCPTCRNEQEIEDEWLSFMEA